MNEWEKHVIKEHVATKVSVDVMHEFSHRQITWCGAIPKTGEFLLQGVEHAQGNLVYLLAGDSEGTGYAIGTLLGTGALIGEADGLSNYVALLDESLHSSRNIEDAVLDMMALLGNGYFDIDPGDGSDSVVIAFDGVDDMDSVLNWFKRSRRVRVLLDVGPALVMIRRGRPMDQWSKYQRACRTDVRYMRESFVKRYGEVNRINLYPAIP